MTGRGATAQPRRTPGERIFENVPGVDDELAAVERAQRRQRRALVAQQAVRVVLEHEQLALGGDLDEAAPAWQGHRHAARVLERRDRVDELRPAALALEAVERLLEQVDAHPVVVHVDLHDVGLVGAEGGHGARVGRRLGDDDVARVDERLADEVDDLLAARRDEDVLGVDRRVLGRHDLRDARLTDACPSVGPYWRAFAVDAAATRDMIAAYDSGGKVEVSGSPPASEMTSGRSVIAMRSRMADDRIPRVRSANRPA
jgi:hypothetical protein